jgi:hypothetical protein
MLNNIVILSFIILYYFTLLFKSKILNESIYFYYYGAMVTHLTIIVFLNHLHEVSQTTGRNILVNIL